MPNNINKKIGLQFFAQVPVIGGDVPGGGPIDIDDPHPRPDVPDVSTCPICGLSVYAPCRFLICKQYHLGGERVPEEPDPYVSQWVVDLHTDEHLTPKSFGNGPSGRTPHTRDINTAGPGKTRIDGMIGKKPDLLPLGYFNITIEDSDGNCYHEDTGIVTIDYDCGSENANKYAVLFEDDGTKTTALYCVQCDSNGVATFDIDKFSDYGIAVSDEDVDLDSLNAEEPTSGGETWIINESPELAGSGTIDVNINFICNNVNYSRIGIYKGSSPSRKIEYGTFLVYRGGTGWEGEFRTITFNTAPTGDLLTWLQANAVKQPTGHSVTFHENGGIPTPENLTNVTMLTDLPVVSKDGYDFNGWYYDPDFQLKANEEDPVTEDIDLYAKFTHVRISLDLSTLHLSRGPHTAQMQLSDDYLTHRDSELSDAITYISYEKLVTPVLSILNNTISWDAIENVNTYGLYVDGSLWSTYPSDRTAINLLSLAGLSRGPHTFKIKANGNSSTYFADSDFSNEVSYTKYTKCATPTLSVSTDGILSWTAITGVSGYRIWVDNNWYRDVDATMTSISAYDITDRYDTFGFNVIALGDTDQYYTNSEASNTVSFTTIPKLDTPTNLEVEGITAEFDPVENAEKYEFFVDGTSIGESNA